VQEVNEILNSEFPIDYPVTDTGMSSFHLSCARLDDTDNRKHANTLMAQCILKYAPNLHYQDKFGRTALHHAAKMGNVSAL